MSGRPIALVFVCLGNICRSPLAKAVFDHLANERGVAERFMTDSCGTGPWHVGEDADERTVRVAKKHGVAFRHVARQIDPEADFERFDLILAMDRANARAIESVRPPSAPAGRVRLLRSFDPALKALGECEPEVPDPYTGGPEDFERVYEMVTAAGAGLLETLLADESSGGRTRG